MAMQPCNCLSAPAMLRAAQDSSMGALHGTEVIR